MTQHSKAQNAVYMAWLQGQLAAARAGVRAVAA